jgi:hypothetical protein
MKWNIQQSHAMMHELTIQIKKNVNGCIVNQIVGAFKRVCVMENHVNEHIVLYMWSMDQM